MQVTLYSTVCPKCKVLTTKLDSKNTQYSIISDIDIMTSKGINTIPVLDVDGNMLDFKAAVEWVNAR